MIERLNDSDLAAFLGMLACFALVVLALSLIAP